MTVLDQAFIKAYQQTGAAPVATPLAFAQPVHLDEALAEAEPKAADRVPPEKLADAVAEVLAKPSVAIAMGQPATDPPKPTDSEEETDEVAEDSPAPELVPAFLKRNQEASSAPPMVESLGIPGGIQRPGSENEEVEAVAEEEPAAGVATKPFVGEETMSPEEAAPTEETISPETPSVKEREVDPSPSGEAKPFRPMLQVDRLSWPQVCGRMARLAGDQLDGLGEAFLAASARGQKILALAGYRPGEGCTTLLLSVARRLAERGKKVVVVDADLGEPQLASRLALLPEAGWEEVVAGQLDLAEVLIESVADRVAVLPWCGPRSTSGETMLSHPPRPEILEPLRTHYDLILVDLGAIDTGSESHFLPLPSAGQWLDAVVLVHDVRHPAQSQLRRVQEYLATANIPRMGVAENFAA